MINKNGFSIIIPSLNQSNFLNDCLKSIHNQKYDNYEIIIVDSKSTDDTANIVKFYKEKYNKIKSFISEQDNGQFDAINKGINIANKDWVTWQNCDDLYYDDQVLNNFNKFINLNPSKKLFVGNIILTNEKLEKVRDLKFVKPSFYSLLYEEMTLTNQSAFWQKSLHQDLGFLKNMRINFDYEWFLRILKNYPDCGTHINKTFGIYRIHQLQKQKFLI